MEDKNSMQTWSYYIVERIKDAGLPISPLKCIDWIALNNNGCKILMESHASAKNGLIHVEQRYSVPTSPGKPLLTERVSIYEANENNKANIFDAYLRENGRTTIKQDIITDDAKFPFFFPKEKELDTQEFVGRLCHYTKKVLVDKDSSSYNHHTFK